MEFNEFLKVLQNTQNLYPALVESNAKSQDAVALYTAEQELIAIVAVDFLEDGELVALFFNNLADFTAYKYNRQKAADKISCVGIEFSNGEDNDIAKELELIAENSVPVIERYIMNQGAADITESEEEMASYLAYFNDNKSVAAITKAFEKSIGFKETGKEKIASVKWSDKTNRFITSKATDVKEPTPAEGDILCEFPRTNYEELSPELEAALKPELEAILKAELEAEQVEEDISVWSRDPHPERQAHRPPTPTEMDLVNKYITEKIIRTMMASEEVGAIETRILAASTESEKEQHLYELRDEFARQLRLEVPAEVTDDIIYGVCQQISGEIYIELLEMKLNAEIEQTMGQKNSKVKPTSTVKPHRAQQPSMKKKKKKGKKGKKKK